MLTYVQGGLSMEPRMAYGHGGTGDGQLSIMTEIRLQISCTSVCFEFDSGMLSALWRAALT